MTGKADAVRAVSQQFKDRTNAVIDGVMAHLRDDNAKEILGTGLSPLIGRGPLKSIVTFALYADVLRMVRDMVMADGEISDEEVQESLGLLSVLAAGFAKVRSKDYASFASLSTHTARAFLSQYGSDKGLFGYENAATQWAGVKACRNVREHCTDSAPLEQLGQTLVDWAQQLIAADGVQPAEQATLDQLKAMCLVTQPDNAKAANHASRAPHGNMSGTPVHFPEPHWQRPFAFSPSGDVLAIGGKGVVSLWDIPSRTLSRVIYGKREANVESLVFSDAGDLLAVYFDDDYRIRVFHTATGDRALVIDGEGNDFQLWATTPTGQLLVSTDRTVEVRELDTGEKLSSFSVSAGFFTKVSSLAVAPSAAKVAVARENDDDLRVYDLSSGARVGSFWGAHTSPVCAVASPAGSHSLVSVDDEGGIAVWDLTTGSMVRQGKLPIRNPLSLVARPCGREVLVSGWSTRGGARATILTCDVSSLREVYSLNLPDRGALQLTRDGSLLAFAAEDGVTVVEAQCKAYQPRDVVIVPAVSSLEPDRWDEDNDPIGGEEEHEGTFDEGSWTLPVEGDIEWNAFRSAVGYIKESSLLSDSDWVDAQTHNRVVTIEHTGDGSEYIGRVGLHRGKNLCRVVVDVSLPSEIRIVGIDVTDIDCSFDQAKEGAAEVSGELISACQLGDVDEAKRLLASGADPAFEDYERQLTPLNAAIEAGSIEIVEALIEAGLSPHADSNAWRKAILSGEKEIAETLEKAGFNVERAEALVQACYLGRSDVAKFLIDAGTSLNESANVWDCKQLNASPLTAAALAGHEQLVEALLRGGADVEQADGRGITPWVAAASGGHDAVCNMLTKRGAKADKQAAFVVAADRCNASAMESLLADVSVDATFECDDRPMSALEASVNCRYWNLDDSETDEDKDTKQERIISLLLSNNASPNMLGSTGEPILHQMVRAGCPAGIRLLALAGADMESLDVEGNTALVVAAGLCNADLVSRLLYRKANPNARRKDGTPAMLLMFHEASSCDVAMAKWFIGYGADLDATDQQGMTLLQHCEQCAGGSADSDDDEQSDDYNAEAARELLQLLSDEERLQRLHGSLLRVPHTHEELDELLTLALGEYDDGSLAYTFVADYVRSHAPEAGAVLGELLEHDDWRLRQAAANTLALKGVTEPEAAELIRKHIGDPDNDVGAALTAAANAYGNTLIDAVIPTVPNQPASRMLAAAIRLLQGDDERAEKLTVALSNAIPPTPETLKGTERLRIGTALALLGQLEERRGKAAEAVQFYEQSVKLNPSTDSGVWDSLASAKKALGDDSLEQTLSAYTSSFECEDFDDKQRLLEQARNGDPICPLGANSLAWLLATHRDAEKRDGVKAVAIATELCERDGGHFHSFLDTLAAALAESGQFAKAADVMKRAIEAAPPAEMEGYAKSLSRYEQGLAWPSADEEDAGQE
jgi:ankyrin repeat protein/tetratricopeptide (TPR) repeat protein